MYVFFYPHLFDLFYGQCRWIFQSHGSYWETYPTISSRCQKRHEKLIQCFVATWPDSNSGSWDFEGWKVMLISGWWFQIFFYFHPYLGRRSNLTNIFQMGWNHQLDINWKIVLGRTIPTFWNGSFFEGHVGFFGGVSIQRKYILRDKDWGIQ